MKKYILTLLAALLACSYAHAQWSSAERIRKELETTNIDTAAWLHNVSFNIGFNEGLLHNWSAGGEVASLILSGLCNASLTRMAHNNIWSNQLSLAYSLNYAYSNDFVPRKMDDRIDFVSKYSTRIDTAKNFYFAGLLNFKSQFTKGYDYNAPKWDTFSTSKFLSPAYFILAAGVEYRKGSDFTLYISPIAGRMILADKYYTSRAATGAFGIDSGKTAKFELGAYFSGTYRKEFMKNVSFRTRLDLYSNYLAHNKKDSSGNVIAHDNPGNINFYSENMFNLKFTRFLVFNLGATFIYDNNIPYSKTYMDANGVEQLKKEPLQELGWWQLRQIFTFGIEYKL
ncbi:DUF3078 domain-containing protein [Chitinophagaceae bacterium MMS25-I14]